MNFSSYSLEKPKLIKKLSKLKYDFTRRREDINVFHYNEVKPNLIHFVINMKDEYQIGTKKIGTQQNLPFEFLVNCFYLVNKNILLVEKHQEQYEPDIVNFISDKIKTNVSKREFNNEEFIKILKVKMGVVKNLEYVNEEKEDIIHDGYLSVDFITKLSEKNVFDRMTALTEDHFITLKKNGSLSISNSDVVFLLNYLEEVANEI